MQFHDSGYVSGDPRLQPPAGVGLDRPAELPDLVDVLIVAPARRAAPRSRNCRSSPASPPA